MFRFGGFSEADLIRYQYAVPLLVEEVCSLFPIGAVEVLPVQKQYGGAVGPGTLLVLVSHRKLLLLRSEGVSLHLIRIVVTFKIDAEGLSGQSGRKQKAKTNEKCEKVVLTHISAL